ncbi:MAG: mannose-1-phosphate guanylyltransferase/mannose-6-phosphate isomerase [Burkholderiales bacterium]|jgi:mannose-1-phosphate guanylyltransferase|nr:mannose-1-phosphate guanylyltransferase/mannose-6-phosphate isomerase [Burkholderiales bacterium]
MIPVIISGGSGSRLWPLSRQLDPKPFIRLSDGNSLLQNTFIRASLLEDVTAILTVTNEKTHFRMNDEYRQINSNNITCDFILEPFGRNTAPAIAVACLYIAQNYSEDETILILPADHLISDFTAFNLAVAEAKQISQDGYIVTFGITPEYPETGYGYIEANLSKPLKNGFLINRFVEKPNLTRAQEYFNSKHYLWNSGMFCAKVSTFLEQFNLHAEHLIKSSNKCLSHSKVSKINNNTAVHLHKELFLQPEDISIDYALLEKSNKVAVIPCSLGWSDIGSWLSIAQTIPKDKDNNAIIGESVLHNTSDCLIYSTNKIVAGVDINNLIIVDTADAVLVADKNNSQNVKIIFERLKQMRHQTYEVHPTTFRPWGTYTVLEESPFYKIKRIEVKPHSSLSLQMHHHRSEHWIVVDGIATVTRNDETFELKANQSTYIEPEIKHRLENKTTENLILIEVQCGTYLGEDDIIRFADQYGRK